MRSHDHFFSKFRSDILSWSSNFMDEDQATVVTHPQKEEIVQGHEHQEVEIIDSHLRVCLSHHALKML
jgi:hypothetical protein